METGRLISDAPLFFYKHPKLLIDEIGYRTTYFNSSHQFFSFRIYYSSGIPYKTGMYLIYYIKGIPYETGMYRINSKGDE